MIKKFLFIIVLVFTLLGCNLFTQREFSNISINIPRSRALGISDIANIDLEVSSDRMSKIEVSTTDTSFEVRVPQGDSITFSLLVTLINGMTLTGENTVDIGASNQVVTIELGNLTIDGVSLDSISTDGDFGLAASLETSLDGGWAFLAGSDMNLSVTVDDNVLYSQWLSGSTNKVVEVENVTSVNLADYPRDLGRHTVTFRAFYIDRVVEEEIEVLVVDVNPDEYEMVDDLFTASKTIYQLGDSIEFTATPGDDVLYSEWRIHYSEDEFTELGTNVDSYTLETGEGTLITEEVMFSIVYFELFADRIDVQRMDIINYQGVLHDSPVFATEIPSSFVGASIADIHVSETGNELYVLYNGSTNGVAIYDISDKKVQPVYISQITFTDSGKKIMDKISSVDGKHYVIVLKSTSYSPSPYIVLDISNPLSPVNTNSIPTGNLVDIPIDMIVSGDDLYYLDEYGIHKGSLGSGVDISTELLVDYYTTRLAINGETFFMVGYDTIDSMPLTGGTFTTISTGTGLDPADIFIDDTYIYIVGGFVGGGSSKGFTIFNHTNNTIVSQTPMYDANLYSSTFYKGIKVIGDYAFIADNGGGLKAFNITDRTKPVLEDDLTTIGIVNDVEISGNMLYVSTSNSGFVVGVPYYSFELTIDTY